MKFKSYKQFVASRPEDIEPVLTFIHKAECENMFNALNALGWPDRVDLKRVIDATGLDRRELASKLGYMGYERLTNPCTKDGRWKLEGRSATVYGRTPSS